MILPPAQRAYIKAFWVIMTLSVSGLLIGTSLMFGNLWSLVPGIGIGCISLIYGLLEINMRVLWIAYKAWNKLAEFVTSCLQTAIIAISFFIVFTLVGRLGSTLHMDPPNSKQSLWVSRKATPLKAYESLSSFPVLTSRRSHWALCFVTWAAKSGKYWSWFLLPFLYLLSLLEVEHEEAAPQGIYTLY